MMFDIGDTAHLETTFADLNGVPTNPTTVILTIQAPDGTQSTPSATNDAAGLYHYDLAITQSGLYLFKWAGSGLISAVQEGEIAVKPSALVAQPPGTIPVSEIIRTALRLAGLMGAAKRTPSPEQNQEGVESLNSMLDEWRGRGNRIPVVTRNLFPITIGQKIYTIGPAGNFNTARPNVLNQAGVVLTNQTPSPEWPVVVFSQQQYGLIKNKDWSSSWPIAIYFEPDFSAGLAKIFVYPIPSAQCSLALYLEEGITEVASLTTGLVLPPVYRRAIEKNLAMELVARNPEVAKPGPRLAQDALEALSVIEGNNHRPLTRTSDLQLRGRGRSNIYGGYSGV